jgi:rubredoxin
MSEVWNMAESKKKLMRCGFCGYEFAEEEGGQGCASCPAKKGCKMIKCPRCNYENPPEPALVQKIKKLFGKLY